MILEILKMPLVDILIGMLIGLVLHGWLVKEDLLIAAKVKALVGAKVAAAKADTAKPVAEVKAVEAKAEGEVKKIEAEVKPEVKPEEKK